MAFRRRVWEHGEWTTAAVVAVLFLRAGLADDHDWQRAQQELATRSNSFYEPRRRALTDGGTVVGALVGDETQLVGTRPPHYD